MAKSKARQQRDADVAFIRRVADKSHSSRKQTGNLLADLLEKLPLVDEKRAADDGDADLAEDAAGEDGEAGE